MKNIVIMCNSLILEAVLNESHTADIISQSIPFEGKANVWGDEIYFEIPCDIGLEKGAKEYVNEGDLAYWPTGRAFCIFFGKTPVSTDERPKAYSAVNVFGRITGDYKALKGVKQGTPVKVIKDDLLAMGG